MKNFSYFFKEGIANLFTNKMVTLMTLLTVIVSLMVTGVFQVVSSNLVHISREIGNQYEFNIYIKDSVADENLSVVQEKIMSIAMVKDAVLKTKAQTFSEFKEKVASDSLLKGLSEEDNPFRNCYIVTLTALDQADYVLEEISLLEEVDSISNNLETSKKLSAIEKKINLYSLIVYFLLAILCLSIVSNIINLSIFSRRKQINIMKYVGATNGFVKAPFIIEGVLVGIVGALLSGGILSYIYSLIYGNFNQVLDGIYLLSPMVVFWQLLAINAVYGTLVGGLGAAFAVSKHVKV